MKLLYFLDFIHFKERGRSVTGEQYFAWDFGPVPRDLWLELKNGPQSDFRKAVKEIKRKIILQDEETDSFIYTASKKDFNEKLFSKRELKILDNISEIFKDALAKDMVETTHVDNTPWYQVWKVEGREYQEIDYMLAFKSQKLAGISAEQAKNKSEEFSYVYEMLGVRLR